RGQSNPSMKVIARAHRVHTIRTWRRSGRGKQCARAAPQMFLEEQSASTLRPRHGSRAGGGDVTITIQKSKRRLLMIVTLGHLFLIWQTTTGRDARVRGRRPG